MATRGRWQNVSLTRMTSKEEASNRGDKIIEELRKKTQEIKKKEQERRQLQGWSIGAMEIE